MESVWRTERIWRTRCIRAASRGRCSQTVTPGTLVWVGANGPRPPAGAAGLRSNRSMWLGPPSMNRRMTARAGRLRASAPASRGCKPPGIVVIATVPRRRRSRREGRRGEGIGRDSGGPPRLSHTGGPPANPGLLRLVLRRLAAARVAVGRLRLLGPHGRQLGRLLGRLPELLAGPRQDRPDRVHRDVRLGADLLVRPALQVVQPDDVALPAGEPAEQLLDFFEALDPLLGGGGVVGRLLGHPRLAALDLLLDLVAAGQLADADPAGDDRQVGGQAGVAAELAEHPEVVGDDLQQDLGGDVLDVLGADPD